jgi:hypothetical protein
MARDGGEMNTAMRWAGVVAVVGNTFLSQDLLRLTFDLMDRVSEGEHVVPGGWMRLSGAAWPATWIYWASHLWVVAALRDVRSSPGEASLDRRESVLTAIVVLEIILIHSLVLMFRGSWHLWPAFLW